MDEVDMSKFSQCRDPIKTALETVLQPIANDEIISVTLQGHPEEYKVSKALLCRASKALQEDLAKRPTETQDRALCLHSCDPITFQMFLRFSQSGEKGLFFCLDEPMENDYRQDPAMATQMHMRFVQLWAFGKAYSVEGLRTVAVKELVVMLQYTQLDFKCVQLKFEVSRGRSDLRDAVVKSIHSDVKSYGERAMEQFDTIDGFPSAFDRMCA